MSKIADYDISHMYSCFSHGLRSKDTFVINANYLIGWFGWFNNGPSAGFRKLETTIKDACLILNDDYIVNQHLKISLLSFEGLDKLLKFMNNNESNHIQSIVQQCREQLYANLNSGENEMIHDAYGLPVIVPEHIALQMAETWKVFLLAEDKRRLLSWQNEEYRRQKLFEIELNKKLKDENTKNN